MINVSISDYQVVILLHEKRYAFEAEESLILLSEAKGRCIARGDSIFLRLSVLPIIAFIGASRATRIDRSTTLTGASLVRSSVKLISMLSWALV